MTPQTFNRFGQEEELHSGSEQRTKPIWWTYFHFRQFSSVFRSKEQTVVCVCVYESFWPHYIEEHPRDRCVLSFGNLGRFLFLSNSLAFLLYCLDRVQEKVFIASHASTHAHTHYLTLLLLSNMYAWLCTHSLSVTLFPHECNIKQLTVNQFSWLVLAKVWRRFQLEMQSSTKKKTLC